MSLSSSLNQEAKPGQVVSLSVSTYPTERIYDSDSDRLFLVYYALPGDLLNANKWGVTERSLAQNIKTAINKPVIICRKNPANIFHTKQAGNFVHPTIEQATAELGHSPSEVDYYQWQEKYAIGRIRDVELRRDRGGYAWTLEITDPDSKEILKSDKYRNGIPGWTSPQILTYPRLYPEEDANGKYDHWVVSHVILTDSPAYGFETSSVRGKCFGAEKECLIKTKSASMENLGFCVKQATIDLVNSHYADSSLGNTQSTFEHTKMSSNSNSQQGNDQQQQTQQTQQTQLPSEQQTVITKTFSEQNPKQEGDQRAPPEGSGIGTEGDAKERERDQAEAESSQPSDAPIIKSLDEANQVIRKLFEQNRTKDEQLKSTMKEMKTVLKWKESIEAQNRMWQVKSVVPADLFKTPDAHNKEVQRIIEKGLDSDLDWLADHYKLMREAMRAKQFSEDHPKLTTKSAALDIPGQYQPPQDNNGSSTNSVDRTLDLARKMFGGKR